MEFSEMRGRLMNKQFTGYTANWRLSQRYS